MSEQAKAPTPIVVDWAEVDAIEVATVGVDTEQPVATGPEAVERIDSDPAGYDFRAHSIYAHVKGSGVVCLADCWDRAVALQLGGALAAQLGVPVDDYTVDMAAQLLAEGEREKRAEAKRAQLADVAAGILDAAHEPEACTGCGTKTAMTEEWTLYPWPDGAWLCSSCNDARHETEEYP